MPRRRSVLARVVLVLALGWALVPVALSTAYAEDCDGDGFDESPGGICVGCEVYYGSTQVTISADPGSPDGQSEWYVTQPLVSVSASGEEATSFCINPQPVPLTPSCELDPVTAPAGYADLPGSCSAPFTLSEGTHTVYAGAYASGSGAGFDSRTYQVDTVAPQVECEDTPPFVLGASGGEVTASATDGTSGPPAQTVSAAVSTDSAGVFVAHPTASDDAGNETVANCSYTVGYERSAFLSPLPSTKVKRGSTVPVKFRLLDADGNRLPDADAQAVATACQATITYTGGTPSAACFRYVASTDTFQFDLKLGKTPTGLQTVTVRVSAGGQVVNVFETTVTVV
ncbi:MAG TPA: PxKF domain-containing protein [Actinomycetes bacterium]|nr:PxKF domain-containing protein [Actinomycetes bacterium]